MSVRACDGARSTTRAREPGWLGRAFRRPAPSPLGPSPSVFPHVSLPLALQLRHGPRGDEPRARERHEMLSLSRMLRALVRAAAGPHGELPHVYALPGAYRLAIRSMLCAFIVYASLLRLHGGG